MQLDHSIHVYFCLSRATGKDRETLSAKLASLNQFEVNERLHVIASDKQPEALTRFLFEGLERLGDVTLIRVPNAEVLGVTMTRDRLTQIFQEGVETVFDKPTGK